VAPRSDLEHRIAEIWRAVLQLEEVGVRDNFFDLGGHSLRLVQVQGRLEEALGRPVAVVELFQHPTIERLARHLGGEGESRSLAAEARARVSRRGSTSEGAIAIVGLSGRFPGAGDVESFWENLCAGVESITFSSEAELRESGVEGSLLRDPRYVPARGVLEGADLFDPGFFGYAPREAELIDPQQRVFLECAWEALEHAGYDPARYAGSIGVYAGSSLNTYLSNLRSRPDLLASVGSLATTLGSGGDFLPTRVSYKLNLRGPSVNVQTACSTSLVAVHLACRALQDQECDLALAGGVSIKVPLRGGYLYLEESIASPDGHCRAFDAGAQGTLGGDGVGIVVLKRLAEAEADGDTIHAVIRGTAINNDGSLKVGYTAPSVEGQAEAIALAQAAAGVEADTITYVEAHGTGTTLGDPIEVAALTQVFGGTGREKGTCALGALKTNVGHLDAAAGVAGLIKTVLSLEHGELVPTLHFERPNPGIDFDAGPFRVNTEHRAWEPPAGLPRRAGVSSFGMGGTNAHAVLEEAPAAAASGASREWQLLVLSARTETALEESVGRLSARLRRADAEPLADVAYTLQTGRRGFEQRRAWVCRERGEALEALEGRAPGRSASGRASGAAPAVAFLLPGQGAQHPNMGRALYEGEAVFREEVDACAELLRPHLGLDLRELLYPESGSESEAAAQLQRTALTQPALFVVEYALAQLWRSWGVEPSALLGHSLGEYVAACLAGVFSRDDALALVALRGRLMDAQEPGAMLSVPLPESEVESLLGAGLSLAAVNAPELCVVSGPEAAVEALEAQLQARELSPRRLHTSHAFHSAMMDAIVEPFTACVGEVTRRAPRLAFVSNVTGTWITAEQATDPAYWGRHLRQAVRFGDGVGCLLERVAGGVLLEVGPGHTLTSLARAQLEPGSPVAALSSLARPGQPERDAEALAHGLGRLWTRGVEIDWEAYHAGERRRRVPLPSYPFQRHRYWIEPGREAPAAAALDTRRNDLADWFYVPSWRRSMPPAPPLATRGRWLLFGAADGVAEALAQRLEAGGGQVTRVHPGEGFAREAEGRFRVAPGRRADHDALVEALRASERLPERLVHLGGVADDAPGDAAALDRDFYGLLHAVQALEAGGVASPLELSVVTRGAQEVTGADGVVPERAAVVSACRVIPQEYPYVSCRAIDLAGSAEPDELGSLVAELSVAPSETAVAYRGGHRWVQCHEPVRLEAPAPEAVPLRRRGVYLITGGLGGIGRTLAQHLATQYQARLVLTTRGGADDAAAAERRRRTLEALEAAGAEVRVVRADVADAAQVEGAVREALEAFGALHGVVHAAGVAGGRVIQRITPEAIAPVLAPKVAGTRALLRALEGRSPEFVLLCSSLAPLLGIAGQADYCAANAYQDAFAQARSRGPGPRVISVNWDTWREVGMAVETTLPEALRERREQALRHALTPEEGVEVFRRILAHATLAQLAVSTRDLAARRAAQRAPLAPTDPAAAEDAAAPPAAASEHHPRPELSTPYVAPRNPVEQTLCDIWQQLLGIERIGVHDDFFELGGHSLLATQILSRVRAALLVEVSLESLFEAPSVAGLAGATPDRSQRLEQLRERLRNLSPEQRQQLLQQARRNEGS
jgi:acyl transferase domain-containing protein